jgi:hypothetical protein
MMTVTKEANMGTKPKKRQAVVAGTSQGCSRATGTYELKK